MIERRAFEIAGEIVMRTSHTMKLEDQANSKERLENAIKDRAEKLKTKCRNIYGIRFRLQRRSDAFG